MKKQEFETTVDLPDTTDALHETDISFPHEYDISGDIIEWETSLEVNNEASLSLTVDNKVRASEAKYAKQDVTRDDPRALWTTSETCNKGFYSNQYIRLKNLTTNEYWFVGRIKTIKKSFDEKGNIISLSCADVTDFLKGVFVEKLYTNQEISYIVKKLLHDYKDYHPIKRGGDVFDETDADFANILPTKIRISNCSFKDKNLYECIDKLAKQSAFDWYVDKECYLYFFRSMSKGSKIGRAHV